MQEMNVLLIRANESVFVLPENIEDIDEWIDYANENIGKFVKLYRINCRDCVFPYVIEEYMEYTPVCINISEYLEFEVDTLFILSKEAYDERLTQLIEENCQDCIHYEDGDDIDSHRSHMCLNGICPIYEPRDDDEDDD